VGARLLAALLCAAIAAGCGQDASAVPAGPTAVSVTITRDFGAATLGRHRAAPGQSAMDALRRVSDVGTRYGGRFVQTIDGLSGDRSGRQDWLYFINGIAPDVGATDMTLHPGDAEWWDRRAWGALVQTPVAIGQWPEPFVHGYGGRRHAVSVTGLGCSSALASSLRAAGARVANGAGAYRLEVKTFTELGDELADWRGKGLTVWPAAGRVMVYHARGGPRLDSAAHALITGYQPPGAPGDAVVVVVAGDTEDAACAAATHLAADPGLVGGTYAVALDARGAVIAAGGRG
jgi:uncharacterized protein DUF4430